jgi:hypothetical protein
MKTAKHSRNANPRLASATWDKLRAEVAPPDDVIPPGALTAKLYAAKFKIPLNTAKRHLAAMVERKLVCVGRRLVDAHRVTFYWPAG